MTAAWAAPPWGRRSVTAARLARSAMLRRVGRVAAAALTLAATGTAAGLAVEAVSPAPIASAGPVALYRTASGLAIDLGFDRPTPLRDLGDTFAFNGSATAGIGTAAAGRYGLAIGVRPHPDRFEGWFAVTRAAFPAAGVYHVEMAKPPGQVRGRRAQGEAVFAVQTGTTKRTGLINYVVVASNSNHGVTTWTVGYAHGHVADASLETLIRYPVPADTSPMRAVTLVTDGRRRLSVWFGDRLGFRSDHLRLDITPPFQPYLEVQAERIAYTSYFHEFWVTTGTAVTVAAPDGTRLELVGATGRPLASATARHGAARLVPPPPMATGTARLVAALGGRRVVLGPFAYAAGDRLQLTGLRPTARPATSRPATGRAAPSAAVRTAHRTARRAARAAAWVLEEAG
ncbi:MAG: hypothetical protein ACYCU7_06840 [Acidimicrobiales bacterium]